MKTSRREFAKRLGITLASVVLVHCKRRGGKDSDPPITCYTVVPDPPTPEVMCYEAVELPSPTPTGQPIERREVLTDVTKTGNINPDTVRQAQVADARQRLRDCWFQLDHLAQSAGTQPDETRQAQETLVEAHRVALDDLVALDEISADVAEHVQAAFTEASYHAWRNNAPITCYIALPVEYEPREDLLLQADKLAEVSGDLDPATVAAARAALARDMAFFDALSQGTVEARDVAGLWSSGEIEVCPEAIEAAQYLINLLLGDAV